MPSVRWLKLRSIISPAVLPMPARTAASTSVIAATMLPSMLRSSSFGPSAKPPSNMRGSGPSKNSGLVLTAVKPRATASLPRAAQIVERADARLAEHLLEVFAVAHAEAAEMRPVKPHAVARRPAEQRIDGDAERLRLHIETGILDRGDRLVGEAAGRELGDAVKRGAELADRARVHAGDDRGVARQHRGDAAADAEIVDVFRPADQPFVGGELQEIKGAPAGIG